MSSRRYLDLDRQLRRDDPSEAEWPAIPCLTDVTERQFHTNTLRTSNLPRLHGVTPFNSKAVDIRVRAAST